MRCVERALKHTQKNYSVGPTLLCGASVGGLGVLDLLLHWNVTTYMQFAQYRFQNSQILCF